jgi:phosphinothricin acetyltransferase
VSSISIRPLEAGDLASIRRIFNHYIKSSAAIFIEEEAGEDWERNFLETRSATHPAMTAVCDGAVAGWASIGDFSSRCCYRNTGEISVYVDSAWHGRGLGRKLAEAVETRAAQAGLHSIVALIESRNTASIHLFERLGYRQAGVLREAGFKFGKWLDVVYYQKVIGR